MILKLIKLTNHPQSSPTSTSTSAAKFNAKLRVLLLVECRFDYKMQHVVSPSPRRSLIVLVKRSSAYYTLVVVESSRLLDAMRRDKRDQLFD